MTDKHIYTIPLVRVEPQPFRHISVESQQKEPQQIVSHLLRQDAKLFYTNEKY